MLAVLPLLLCSQIVGAASIALFDYGFNIDGTVSERMFSGDPLDPFDPIPAQVDIGGFNESTGLGAITATITGVGAHTFDVFFDHEIDEPINTYFNENGSASGAAAAGQSWEIDEPGYIFGDIFTNFLGSTLDNGNGVPSGLEDDVSMAMGWDFNLGVDETAIISLFLSEIAPTSGFYLVHSDPDSSASIFLSSTLRIIGVPEPSLIWLLVTGLLGFSIRHKARSNR